MIRLNIFELLYMLKILTSFLKFVNNIYLYFVIIAILGWGVEMAGEWISDWWNAISTGSNFIFFYST